MKLKNLFLFLFLLSISCFLSAQMRFAWTTSPDTILVESNKFQITTKDLHERIVALNLLQTPYYRTIEGQKQILESMIYEYTFTTHAHEIGLDQLPAVTEAIYKDSQRTALRLYLLEEYKKEINFRPDAIEVFYHEDTEIEIPYPMALFEYYGEGESPDEDDLLEHPTEILRIEPDRRIRNSQTTKSGARIHLFRESDFESTLQRPFSELRDEIELVLIEKNREELFNKHIEKLTEKYGVTTNNELLKNIGVGDGDRFSTYESLDPHYQMRYNDRFWGVQSIIAPAELLNHIAVESKHPEIQMTMLDIEQLFRQAASREVLLTDRDSPKLRAEVINNEIERRMLNLAVSEANTFEKYHDSPELKTVRSDTILRFFEKQEILDQIEVTPEEINELYQKNIQNHTFPAQRNIRQFVSLTKKEAKKHHKEFTKMLRENETTKIIPYIRQYSLNTENEGYIFDIYNDGFIPGLGEDKVYNKLVWEMDLNKLSPIFKNSTDQYVFFYVVSEKPELIRPLDDYEKYYRDFIFKQKADFLAETLQNDLKDEFEVTQYLNKIQSALKPEELFLYAETARNRGNNDDMIAFLDYIIADYPNTEDAFDALVVKTFFAIEDLDNKEMAIQSLEELIENYSTNDFYESALLLLNALKNNEDIEVIIQKKLLGK